LRREKINVAVAEIETQIDKSAPLIFCGRRDWDLNLLGTIASILAINYNKPVFVYKILNGQVQGAARSIDGVDSVALMKKCPELLMTFGGHPKASGFRAKTENMEKFKECLTKNLDKL
jgi:Single-stranded DNA-specific exonuclease